ncbi:hypothetical protein H4219_000408 [Mycoemilia scoparia]|uniref:Cas1p 10 TM acyl transferase domain-containing protein n=1 Tax=Mycoemilia scoparia TaxID=417184 RepID=A0A9W8ABT3_9FUNG|nr:hypothetical protein H4219_000408 [Mycoemilia scoparia]
MSLKMLFQDLPVNVVVVGLLSVIFALSLLQHLMMPQLRDHCLDTLTRGSWLPNQNYTWEAEGCTLKQYKPKDITECYSNTFSLFIGDSNTRAKFYTFAASISPGFTSLGKAHTDIPAYHSDGTLGAYFIWDQYLNSERTQVVLSGVLPMTLGGNTVYKTPDLLVLGTGVWHLAYKDQSGGIPKWRDTIDAVAQTIMHDKLHNNPPRIAKQVYLSPIHPVVPEKLAPHHKENILPEEIDWLNKHIGNFAPAIDIPFAWFNMEASTVNQTTDGLHYTDQIESQVFNIIHNHNCNQKILKSPPYYNTCCFRYPQPANIVQVFLVLTGLLYVLIGVPYVMKVFRRGGKTDFNDHTDSDGDDGEDIDYIFIKCLPDLLQKTITATCRKFCPAKKHLNALLVFLGILGVMYFNDRTTLFDKMQKNFDSTTFTVLFVATIILGGLTTMARIPSSPSSSLFLNRDQTEEWRGWMQIIILIYHYMNASKVMAIYNPVRVFVAMYLFMTGYGHFTFFYKKADYSGLRMTNILIRINLLALALSYVMNTSYMDYYFAPLISVWFLIIWLTMRVYKHRNKQTGFLVTKIVAAAVICTVLNELISFWEILFSATNAVFKTNWSSSEWRFRFGLDIYIVFVGMLFALGTIKISESRFIQSPGFGIAKRLAIPLSFIALVWFGWFEATRKSKYSYNHIHPYISFIPILAFVVARNCTKTLRSGYSFFFAYIGRCSLETFIAQFHLWLAADTKGLLVYVHPRLWYINFAVTSFVFVVLCSLLNQATGVITEWFCAPFKSQESLSASNRPRHHTPAHDPNLIPISQDNSRETSQSPLTKSFYQNDDAIANDNNRKCNTTEKSDVYEEIGQDIEMELMASPNQEVSPKGRDHDNNSSTNSFDKTVISIPSSPPLPPSSSPSSSSSSPSPRLSKYKQLTDSNNGILSPLTIRWVVIIVTISILNRFYG